MRIDIIIDDKLIEEAIRSSGLLTKKEVIEEALKLFVQVSKQGRFKTLKGKLKWEGSLDEMRMSK